MLSIIINKVRNLIEDFPKSRTDPFLYTTNNEFDLSENNVISVTKVTVDGVDTADLSGVDYTYDSTANTVTVTGLTTNDIVQVIYSYYDYSTTELEGYIQSALDYLNIYSPNTYELDSADAIDPVPTGKVQAIIAIVTSIIIKPLYSQYRLPVLTVVFPEKLSKDEKIEGLIHNFYYDNNGSFINIEIAEYGSA